MCVCVYVCVGDRVCVCMWVCLLTNSALIQLIIA